MENPLFFFLLLLFQELFPSSTSSSIPSIPCQGPRAFSMEPGPASPSNS